MVTKETTPSAVLLTVPIATPENTPVPGGGRWAWSAADRRWVDQDTPVNPDLIEINLE